MARRARTAPCYRPYRSDTVPTLVAVAIGTGRPLRALVDEHREAIRAVARRHGARSIALFGSVARGDETAESDLDFLVEFEPGRSLFDLLHLQDELGELLGGPVDVVAAGGLKDRDEDIRREAVPL